MEDVISFLQESPDSKLSFDKHIKMICKKASNKLGILARVTLYVAIEKKEVLMNYFFDSQFNYCPLFSMCHSRRDNTKITNLHGRCFWLIYSDKKSSYEELLEKRWLSFYSPQEYSGTCKGNV